MTGPDHTPPTALRRAPRRCLIIALSLAVAGLAHRPGWPQEAPRGPLVIAVSGNTNAYLEPCGCGGQNAGGLARRAQMLGELRRQTPSLLTVDVGGLGHVTDRLPVIARALAVMGVAACGASAADLSGYAAFAAACRGAGLPYGSLVPPLVRGDQPAPPRALVLAAPGGGPRVGLVSVALGSLTNSQLTAAAASELTRLRTVERCAFSLLISHLGDSGTERVVAELPAAARPLVVLLATEANLPAAAYERLGCWWVPVANKGRSLSVLTVVPVAGGWSVSVDQRLLTDGPRDAVVQGYVDAYYQQAKAAEPVVLPTNSSVVPVTSCLPCHQRSVAAWRRHSHARAVETLAHAGREVAECLRCHDERFRREGQRSPQGGDRGVECTSCHGELSAHLADVQSWPKRPTEATCRSCHNSEHSPRYQADRYRQAVRAVCAGGGR